MLVPKGPIRYAWNGEIRTRNGEFVRKGMNGSLIEFVDEGDIYASMVLDIIDIAKPHATWEERSRVGAKHVGVPRAYTRHKAVDLTNNSGWEWAVESLTRDDVACVRLIHKDAVYEPDEVMGTGTGGKLPVDVLPWLSPGFGLFHHFAVDLLSCYGGCN